MDVVFPASWFAAGLVTEESAADFARLAAQNPSRSLRHWRWLAVRDYLEENSPLPETMCRAIFRLGEVESDTNLGTAMMCCAIYQRKCPHDVRDAAHRSDRAAVRRAALLTTSTSRA